jgi:hypothetical protein
MMVVTPAPRHGCAARPRNELIFINAPVRTDVKVAQSA